MCQGSPFLQGVQVNHSVLVLQVWHPRPLQGDPWPQEYLGHHPFHWLHQNSVLEHPEVQSLLWDQENLHGWDRVVHEKNTVVSGIQLGKTLETLLHRSVTN